MIRPSYILKLSHTKLRSKRGMLAASVAVASLLFSVLIATVVVFTGAEKSANDFIKKAGNDRYLVKVSPNIPHEKLGFLLIPSLQEIREIKVFEKQYYQELREKYKSLGLEYDDKSEVRALEPYAFADKNLPDEQRVRVNFSSPVIQEMSRQKIEAYTKAATNKYSDLKVIGDKYGATGYYIVDRPSLLPSIPQLRLIHDGKEDFNSYDLETGGDFTDYGYFTNAIYNGMYSFTDQKNLPRYLLTTDASDLKGIPVVVSAQEAAALFGEEVGIGKEPESASEKREWLRSVQEKLNGYVYQACYRNSVEQSMLEKIQRDYAEIKNNEGNKDYQKPSVIYDYPKEACGDIVVKEDALTAAEKQADLKAEAIQKKLGTYTAPKHSLLTFQIVGFRHAQPYLDQASSVEEYVKSLLSSQSDVSSIDIPAQMYDKLPEDLKISDIQGREDFGDVVLKTFAAEEFASRILEFSSVQDARAFLDNEACAVFDERCDKEFTARPYGSNYLILDEISKLFNKVAAIAFPAALFLAAMIIWLTVSRIMAESRKETAIYRAMGAKRRDIAGIYIVYVLRVALRIAIVSVALGVAAAFAIDYFYGSVLTDTAVAAFGIVDDASKFSLFSLASPLLIYVVGSIFAMSLIASIQPLIRNTRRSPIRDIREDG